MLHFNLKRLTMAPTDNDYSTETESDRSFSAIDFDQIVQEAEARQISPRELLQKKRKVETKPRAMIPQDLRAIALMDKHITKHLYGQDYEYNTSLRVIGVALHMQKGYLQKVQRVGKEKAKSIKATDQRHGLQSIPHWT
jgi:hypothetical protein